MWYFCMQFKKALSLKDKSSVALIIQYLLQFLTRFVVFICKTCPLNANEDETKLL